MMKKYFDLIREQLKKPEFFFLYTASLFGLLFIVIIPPFQLPDEDMHFYRSYEISEFRTPTATVNGKKGSYLPLSIRETQDAVRGSDKQIRFNIKEKYNLRYTKHSLLNIPLNPSEKTFYATSSSPVYNPIAYIPQAIAISFGKVFNSPVILLLYLVRVVNLILWVVMIFYAIKIVPWKKWAIAIIALLPIVVSQSISPGVDVLVFGSSLLFIALIMRGLDRKRISGKDTVLLLLFGVIMTAGKSVSIALLPLIFLIQTKDIKLKYPLLIKLLVVFIPIFIYLTLTILLSGGTATGVGSTADTQLHSVLTQPWIFMIELISTYFFVWGDAIFQSLIGTFGWLDTPLSSPFVILGYIILFIAIFVNYNEHKIVHISKSQKWLMSFVAAAYFGLASLAMYIYASVPANNFISGIQGRYFIPVLFMLAIIFSSLSAFTTKKDTYIKVITTASIILLIASSVTIFFRYYITYFQ